MVSDTVFLGISELKELRKQQHICFYYKKKSYYHRRKLKDKLFAFFEWFEKYCEINLRSKEYSDKQIAECVLRENINSEHKIKEYLQKSLYLARIYVKHLNTKITTRNVLMYQDTIMEVDIDLEWLVATFEVKYKKRIKKITLKSGRRSILNPFEIYLSAVNLFHIEEINKITDLNLRELKPLVMFQVRQLLELFGKELIGFQSIQDSSGGIIKKFTLISWDFILFELKKTDSRISAPFDFDTVLKILKWSNSFVHSTFLYSSYIQYFVLNSLKILFLSSTDGIKIFNGRIVKKNFISEIEIRNYNSLKSDFEGFLETRMPGIKVNWMETNRVGAYIISL